LQAPGFRLVSAWFQPLNLKCDILVSKYAFKCNLYRYDTATGDACFVAGGGNNTAAGKRSFVAGSFAHAAHAGAVVFADGTSTAAKSTAPNQFLVQHADARKPGGGTWVTPSDRRTLDGDVKPYSKGLTALKRITPMAGLYKSSSVDDPWRPKPPGFNP
jgi:hypothetical protein